MLGSTTGQAASSAALLNPPSVVASKEAPISDASAVNGGVLPATFFGADNECPSVEGFRVADGSLPPWPPGLKGGQLLDQIYAVSPKQLNALIWGPDCSFQGLLREELKASDPHEGPWLRTPGEPGCIAVRHYDYLTAPSMFIKSSRSVEQQRYVSVGEGRNGWGYYVVHVSNSIKGVPQGDRFTTETQFCIMPLKPAPGNETVPPQQACRLHISYEPRFIKKMLIQRAVEKGMAQSLKQTYAVYEQVLGTLVAPLKEAPSTPVQTTRKGVGATVNPVSLLQHSVEQALSHGAQRADRFLAEPVVVRPRAGLVYGGLERGEMHGAGG